MSLGCKDFTKVLLKLSAAHTRTISCLASVLKFSAERTMFPIDESSSIEEVRSETTIDELEGAPL